jgi:hypothetical protein
MRVAFACFAALALSTASLSAQGPGQFQPPPDHWISLDSLATVLNLSADQRKAVAPHQAAIDSIVHAAAEQRAQMRAQMQGGGGPPSEADRARFADMRTKFQDMQTAAEHHLDELKALLTDQQNAKLAELREIQIAFRRRAPGE